MSRQLEKRPGIITRLNFTSKNRRKGPQEKGRLNCRGDKEAIPLNKRKKTLPDPVGPIPDRLAHPVELTCQEEGGGRDIGQGVLKNIPKGKRRRRAVFSLNVERRGSMFQKGLEQESKGSAMRERRIRSKEVVVVQERLCRSGKDTGVPAKMRERRSLQGFLKGTAKWQGRRRNETQKRRQGGQPGKNDPGDEVKIEREAIVIGGGKKTYFESGKKAGVRGGEEKGGSLRERERKRPGIFDSSFRFEGGENGGRLIAKRAKGFTQRWFKYR